MKIGNLAKKLNKCEDETRNIIAALASTDPRFKSVSMLSENIDDNLAEIIIAAKDNQQPKTPQINAAKNIPAPQTSTSTDTVANNIQQSGANVHLTQDAFVQIAVKKAIEEGGTIANVVTASKLQAMTQQLAANELQIAQWFVKSSNESMAQIVRHYDATISDQLLQAEILPPNDVAALMAAIQVDRSLTIQTKALLPTVE